MGICTSCPSASSRKSDSLESYKSFPAGESAKARMSSSVEGVDAGRDGADVLKTGCCGSSTNGLYTGFGAAGARLSAYTAGRLNTGGGSGCGSTKGVNFAVAGTLKTGSGSLLGGGSLNISRRDKDAPEDEDARGAENTGEKTCFSSTVGFGAENTFVGAWNTGDGAGGLSWARDAGVVVVGVLAASARRLVSGVCETGLARGSSSLKISNCEASA